MLTDHQIANQYIRVQAPPLIGSPELWLQPEFWQGENAVVGQSTGRNTVWFVSDGEREYVLRHYYRGGLPGKLLTDQFVFTGLEKTRSMAEFNLLATLYDLGLPVPKPIAAGVQRSGFIYRANLLIERVMNANDVFQVLRTEPLTANAWQQIGAMIANFHRAGLYHSDLNCHNILWQRCDGSEKPWLIDFDRCELRMQALGKTAWKEANLARLKRSLEKELGQQTDFYWQQADWQALMAGYNNTELNE
ncbi:3-deoxy-D-manno-octulosonic acid kinase [Aliidiomarina iranensis]|uniref:3-deoxy-D-manno-octulosonic acid kinase n=1 Tax=Aliidiomarina iranensis TaxID=1434071 RepID=A0A432W0E6_9GAMM|nr:3-deoxy-D-manno-octulosonic acid kinase [Aliidiomarina iranensis]RUO22463.1 3-deoxy-D-manno-octulosonic acid kinase [Aliidiomarina iranensis]